ncbi:MAG: hypothetical protein ACYDEJ_16510 [Desulfitobacteriaceae bacterium]
MGTNSIKANLSKDDIISEIKLSLGFDVRREHTFLIVEGNDDLKFWRNFASEKVTLFDSFSGKEGINEIIQDHFISNPRVIGVRDRDYQCNSIHSSIFYYDYCCLEMMLIKSDEAFFSIYNEYYSDKYSVNELRDILLKQLQYISMIRKNNEVHRWGIKINGISINDSFDSVKKVMLITKIILKLNEMNSNYFIVNSDKQSQIDLENKIELNSEQLLLITQGHDFLKLFAAFCQKPKVKDASDKTIAASLRCAYRKSDFITTTLYSQLATYESQHVLKIVS